jgi:hypothetical protein
MMSVARVLPFAQNPLVGRAASFQNRLLSLKL